MATGRIGTTPVLQVRWSKAPSAGTTSLSGLDDNSVSLVYSVGYEAVYQNGVLLSRGNDYTATNGTTITLTTATVAGDIIEVFANQTIPLTDTYSQTVANGKFINNTLTTTTGDIIYASAANTPARLAIGSTDQVLKVSGGIPAWGAAPGANWSLLNSGGTALTGAATITVSGISGVDKLMIIIIDASGGTSMEMKCRINGSSSAVYATAGQELTVGSTYSAANIGGGGTYSNDNIPFGRQSTSGTSKIHGTIRIDGANSSGDKAFQAFGAGNADGANGQRWYQYAGVWRSSATISSIQLSTDAGNFDGGTVYVYTSA